MIRDVLGKSKTSDEFHVLDIDENPVRIIFQKQVEDIIINTPDGDLFIGWDYDDPSEFTPENAMLITSRDNMKEIAKERCTQFYLMGKEKGKTIRVYICVQK